MKVLILASSFAPDAVVASHRFSNIVSRMPKYGIQPIVLATSKRRSLGIDKSLPKVNTLVYRVPMIPEWPPVLNSTFSKIFYKLWRIVSPIDNAFGWVPFAVVKGIKLVHKSDIKTVIATCPPRSALFAAFLISELTKSKLILDYRDPWTGNRQWKTRRGNARFYNYLEKNIIEQAVSVVVCTEYMKREFIAVFDISPEKIKVITNGFQPGTINAIVPEEEKYNITYAGSFYGDRNLRMLIDPFIMLQNSGIISSEIRVHVYGKCTDEDMHAFRKSNLTDTIVQHDSLDHDNILRVLAGSDALFLPSGGDVLYALPYKLFDYLKVKKPILAVAPVDSEVHRFMKDYQVGEFAELGNSESIFRALSKIYTGSSKFLEKDLDRFHWDNIAREYSEHISITSSSKSRRSRLED